MEFIIANGPVREIKCRYNLISRPYQSMIKTRYMVYYFCPVIITDDVYTIVFPL